MIVIFIITNYCYYFDLFFTELCKMHLQRMHALGNFVKIIYAYKHQTFVSGAQL